MIFNLPWQSQGDELDRYKEEINKENRIAIRMLAFYGVPLSAVITISHLIFLGMGAAVWFSIFMMMYYAAFLLFEHFLLPEDYPYSTTLLYLMETPVMLMAVLLGTVLDPHRAAVTVLLFLIALPAFIMDRPDRLLIFTGLWAVLFLVMCFICKDPSVRILDALHIFEFFVTSVALVNVILRVRLESLRHLIQGEYHLEHERQTDCLNRYALASRAISYVDQEVVVLLADMDRFTLYNDFYGHEAGQKIIDYFAAALTNHFGRDNIYHYNGDEFLCVLKGQQEEDYSRKIALCREELDNFILEEKKLPLTCAFGYVTGRPADVKEFHEMIQLADIYAHKAKTRGLGGYLGDVFSQEHLRSGIVESNLMTHAKSYEINQLTGLPGMSYFVSRSDALLNNVAEKSRNPVVGYFKLVNMRDYNDAFGYGQGDELIVETSHLLLKYFSDRYICHITAAKFGILCYEEEISDALRNINESLRDYKEGFPVRGQAGFARFTGSESVISLMDQAKIAQETLPRGGELAYCFYDQVLDTELHFRQYIISHVDEAIRSGWLQVYYQPIVRSVTGHVCNEEALSRWIDPQYGFLSPGRFIPTLEENGLMYKVNLHVVRQVLNDFERRKENGVPLVPVSVNLSRKDFEKCDMVQEIADLVDASGYSRDMIKIEITESAFIKNQELLRREVERFRTAGFDVWMDDFGSEYSTLNLLQDLDFDLIKIDMQFMENFSITSKNYIIISDIIHMARRMGITTLIEGVETRDQFRLLQSMGCEKIQGFLFNKPNPFEYILERVRTRTGLHFEDPKVGPYYAAIGGIDLNEPLSYGKMQSESGMEKEMAAGVLELSQQAILCLRSTDRFVKILEEEGAIDREGALSQISIKAEKLPEAFLSAAVRSVESSGWINFNCKLGAEGDMSVYMCKVANVTGGDEVAILTVLLESHGK